ncbi:hypothetical protein CsSME_00028961 [Camellia sinensis var. sinensis]
MSSNEGVGVRIVWKVPTKSMEPKLGAAAEARVKRVKEWREKEGARWDELVQPSALFAVGLGPQPIGGDMGPAELEARRKAQEAEDMAILAKASKFKESQADRPPKSIARERIRPRPKPLGEKDLGGFEPQPPLVDPLKERAYEEMRGVVKKKKRLRRSEGKPALKRRKKATTEQTPLAREAEEAPEMRLEGASKEGESGAAGLGEEMQSGRVGAKPRVEPRGEPQPQEGLAPQGEGARPGLKTAFYHVPAVSGRVEGEGREARMVADRLLGVVEDAAIRSMACYTEAELMKGLCSAQMEAATLAGALLNKAAVAKGE